MRSCVTNQADRQLFANGMCDRFTKGYVLCGTERHFGGCRLGDLESRLKRTGRDYRSAICTKSIFRVPRLTRPRRRSQITSADVTLAMLNRKARKQVGCYRSTRRNISRPRDEIDRDPRKVSGLREREASTAGG